MSGSALERGLRARRESGGRAFVPYVTGGYPGVEAALLRGLEAAGADAIEVGIPFSDPVMDGGVIQEASRISLERGTRPSDVLDTIREAALDVPVAVMTYVNPVHRHGFRAFVAHAAPAGVSGLIVPDLPVDEAGELAAIARSEGIANVLLASPGSTPERLARIGAESEGFVYCVATYGVTGSRDELASTAQAVVSSLRPLTDLPLLTGVGLTSPQQAAEACRFADGAIVGSALMNALMRDGSDAALELAAMFRAGIAA